jgi:hypothetical protein
MVSSAIALSLGSPQQARHLQQQLSIEIIHASTFFNKL